MTDIAAPDPAALEAFDIAPESLERAPTGLINLTWFAQTRGGERLALQRLHKIFAPEVNNDIDALTQHLATKGLITPRVVRTRDGALWIRGGDAAVWRALSYIDGVTRHALETAEQAREAGRVLAMFHHAVSDFERGFANPRLGVHDTQRHLAVLRDALGAHAAHPEHATVKPLAERIFELAARLPRLPPADDRIVHGDPKVSNVLFERSADRALCLIDLDTLARMPVALELGDALRSWCNPAAEDAPRAGFAQWLFEAALEGYAGAAAGFLERREWQAIPAATLTITVELAARFCADSLNERYFGWDRTRYPSASAHNQARTRNQLRVAEDVLAALPAMERTTARIFGR